MAQEVFLKSDWQVRRVPLKFGIGDRILFAHHLRLQVSAVALGEGGDPVADPAAPQDELAANCVGFYLRALPVSAEVPRLSRASGWLRYVTGEYGRCYIDLSSGLEAYRGKFSSKTRSTINRKVRKFQEHCGGRLDWQVFRTVEEMAEFHRLARVVSSLTYQERLLEAGLPEAPEFIDEMNQLASQGMARGYILWHDRRPVAYLYCPVKGNAFLYAYLGYDPEYMKLSVGTVLQWLAFEDLFECPPVRYFDFDEGQSDHKRLFATHEQKCVNVMFVRDRWAHACWIRLHMRAQDGSAALGRLATSWGLKARLRRVLRFGF